MLKDGAQRQQKNDHYDDAAILFLSTAVAFSLCFQSLDCLRLGTRRASLEDGRINESDAFIFRDD